MEKGHMSVSTTSKRFFTRGYYLYLLYRLPTTFPKTNIAPENRPSPKGKPSLFQPPIFRAMLVPGRVYLIIHISWTPQHICYKSCVSKMICRYFSYTWILKSAAPQGEVTNDKTPWKFNFCKSLERSPFDTVDDSEIRLTSWIWHYLHGFKHPRWCRTFPSTVSLCPADMRLTSTQCSLWVDPWRNRSKIQC